MNRNEHLQWCKDRALQYLDRNSQYYDVQNAFASFMSDIRKSDETKQLAELAGQLGVAVMMSGFNHDAVKKFIEGFN